MMLFVMILFTPLASRDSELRFQYYNVQCRLQPELVRLNEMHVSLVL